MKIWPIALGMTLAFGSGTVHAAIHEHDKAEHQMSVQSAADKATHSAVGVLKAVNLKAGKVQIEHEAISDLSWPSMVMWFPLREPLPTNLKVGDAVRFELIQGKKDQWGIVKVERR